LAGLLAATRELQQENRRKETFVKCGEQLVCCFGSEPPIFSVGYEAERLAPADSGYSVLFQDAPSPREIQGGSDPRTRWMCLSCLLDEHPEVGRGLDVARKHGAADLGENGEWHGRPVEAAP
jgi:hypothetical protein